MSEKLKSLTVKTFWKKVDKTDKCWNWTGYCMKRKWAGYGIITMNRKQFRTHRFSWLLHYGKIPNGMCVLHRCDNPKCVNPHHLFLGSRMDNNRDRDLKGRNTIVYGETNGKSKLKLKQVREIKSHLKYCKYLSLANLARKFNTTYQNIQAIAKGKTWKSA